MHEASLMVALMRNIETVAAQEGAGRVTAVRVRLGALSHMTPEHFREHWAVSAAGSVAEQAELQIETSDDIAEPAAQDVLLLSVDVEDGG